MSRAPLLEARGLSIETPEGRLLVRELELLLDRERVAIVGRNGVGKSTLLDVLAGRRAPAAGAVVRRGSHWLVPQDLGSDDRSRDPLDSASPGQRQRRRLEEALAERPDLLFLDEPTRDLDQAGLHWLLGCLTRWRGGLLVVSHDRRILRTFQQFVVVAEHGCHLVRGSFDDLLREMDRREAQARRQYFAGLNRLEAQEEHNAALRGRRQRKQNVGRIRELERCPARIKLNDKRSYKQESQGKRRVVQDQRIGAAREAAKASRRALDVSLPLDVVLPVPPEDVTTSVLSGEGLAAAVNGRCLFRDVSIEISRERVALSGPSGAGKTTLLEMALGLRPPTSGYARCQEARLGYVAQNADNWRSKESLLELLEREANRSPPSSPLALTAVLNAHRFPVALADRSLRSLSPGERLRAALIALTRRRRPIELLVLDEPTQHLDFRGLAALETVLAAWRGGLLIVSHDAAFLEAVGVSRRMEL